MQNSRWHQKIIQKEFQLEQKRRKRMHANIKAIEHKPIPLSHDPFGVFILVAVFLLYRVFLK